MSDLLDGQLAADEEDRAWAHVHGCHGCRDLVEREGWVKTRLAGLTLPEPAPSGLHSSLLDTSAFERTAFDRTGYDRTGDDGAALEGVLSPGDAFLLAPVSGPRPRRAGLVALGGGAAGAAVMGVLALGAAPAQAPTLTPRVPIATVSTPAATVSVLGHQRRLNLP